MSTRNQIFLAGEFRQQEAVAQETINPGELIQLRSDGEVELHSSEGDFAERAFAIEDALQGNTIDDEYSADDLVQYVLAAPGSLVNAMVAANEDVSKGDLLISDGDGCLIKEGSAASSTTVKQVIGVAMEDSDESSDTLVPVRIL